MISNNDEKQDTINPLSILNIDKSKPTIASTNLQYTASTHDHKQTLELDTTTTLPQDVPQKLNLERDFPVEVMASDSLKNTPKKPKLVRTYSETETTNFNSTTGVRTFDDAKHRPYHGFPSTRRISFSKPKFEPSPKQQQQQIYGINSKNNKVHRSINNNLFEGIEDEYVPDFKFNSNLINKWFDDDEIFLQQKKKIDLHTDLTPISVPLDLNNLQSLPDNFKELPFSQRKKLLLNIYPNHNYTELTNMIKHYVKSNNNSNTSLNKLSKTSSHTASSSSILASYLSNLRMTSSTTLNNATEHDINKKGSVVMNHVLLDIVGHGAWGVIRECKDLTTNELRACKIISVKNNSIKRIFMNEIKIWSLLNHENILPLLSFKETNDNIFAITTLNYGGTLFELIHRWGYIKDTTIDKLARQNRILNIVRQILKGLKYMHEKNIIHGDLKLENILINKDDKIMICDFGMSKLLSTREDEDEDDEILSITAKNKLGPSLTSTMLRQEKKPDKHIGSLPYALPELFGAHVKVSLKQDIWSMGILIYTMLIGELPFKHDYEPRLKMMILKGKFNHKLLQEEYANSKLCDAVDGCLKLDLKLRWCIDKLYNELM